MQSTHRAHRAPSGTPEKAEGQDRTTSLTPVDTQITTNNADFAGEPLGGQQQDETVERQRVEQQDKRIATAKARAALAGIELHIVSAGTSIEFIATRWNLTRSLSDIEAAEHWLDIVSGVAR